MGYDAIDPAALANEYLELAQRIEAAELRQSLIKDNLKAVMPLDEGALAQEKLPFRQYGEALVQWVKGRRNEKVDVKKLRKVLVLAGVDLEILEGAFEAATTVSVGDPTLRVSKTGGVIIEE